MAKKKQTNNTKSSGRERKVPEKKIRMLEELKELLLKNNTLILASLRGMPSSQFQKIRKKLRGKATVKVVKKLMMLKALEEASKEKNRLREIEKYLEEGSATLFSQLDAFELSSILADERTPIKAKAEQTAPHDIKVEAGPTDIPTGPMISELSSVGIKIAVESGKITIKQDSVLVREGEKISDVVASVLSKLEILPFIIGLEPIAAYDSKTNKVYVGIRIDKKETEQGLVKAANDARALAFAISYPCKEIINMLIAKAVMQEKAIENILNAKGAQSLQEVKQEAASQESQQSSPE